MSYHNKQRQAKRNIQQVKGFTCPTCGSYVPRGYEVCYNCGDDPVVRPSSSYNYHRSPDYDNFDQLDSFFFFWFTFIAPIFYMLIKVDDGFNALLVIPNFIILVATVVSILIKRTDLGCLSVPIRIWVLTFSVLTLISNIKYF